MFGLNFAKKSAKWQQEYQSVLAHYQSAIFPIGIDASFVSSKSTQTQCELVLPFAARSEASSLEAYLHEQLGREVALEISIELDAKPRFGQIKHIVLVASGKGGVGKSTCAIGLALALRDEGAKVGILDADIYGPSIPLLLGQQSTSATAKNDKQLHPVEFAGLKAQSIGFLVPSDDATVWRGPMASQALSQLLNETDWQALDYLIVDMPPGTGDIQLTMSQKVPASGAVVVTTPQDLALADAQKGINMFSKVNVPMLGLIENMSQFSCPSCGHTSHVFGCDGAQTLAQRYGVPVLAELPLSLQMHDIKPSDKPITQLAPELGTAFSQAAKQLASSLYYQYQSASSVEITITDD